MKDYTESVGHWGMEALGYKFSSTRLSNTIGFANHPGPAQTKPLHTVGEDKIPVMHTGKWLGKTVWVAPRLGKGKLIHWIIFSQESRCTWWIKWKGGEIWCVPQQDLTLGENNPRCKLYVV